MEVIHSRRLSFLTLDYIQNEPENKIFDRKSSRVQPSALAPTISAFANAEGGCIVIGVSDKKRHLKDFRNWTRSKSIIF
ncbi:MAG: ATP-binding protein [Thermoguttaceae bacterium]|nr:ATP-binding protein [Thermoguttaceae bacterium]